MSLQLCHLVISFCIPNPNCPVIQARYYAPVYNATEQTAWSCPHSSPTGLPVSASQIRTVPSSQPASMHVLLCDIKQDLNFSCIIARSLAQKKASAPAHYDAASEEELLGWFWFWTEPFEQNWTSVVRPFFFPTQTIGHGILWLSSQIVSKSYVFIHPWVGWVPYHTGHQSHSYIPPNECPLKPFNWMKNIKDEKAYPIWMCDTETSRWYCHPE